MSEHHENVARCIRETVVHSQTSFTCMGQPCSRLAPRVRRAMTAKTARSYLVYQLQSLLYGEFYIRGNLPASNWIQASSNDAISFAQALSRANAGTACQEDGWILVQVKADKAVVRKGGLQLYVQTSECTARDASLQVGSPVSLHLSKELFSASPGYYMALGNRGDIAAETSPIVRLYWNLRADGALAFVGSFTRLLNESDIYFRLKVLNDPAAYSRCDAGVLYFHKANHRRVAEAVSALYGSIGRFLNADVPMFTRRIAPGLGLAEDPGTHESFGQHRCRILAEGIIRAHEEKAKSHNDRLKIVESQFASEGIRLNEPHLNPRSEDQYTFTQLG